MYIVIKNDYIITPGCINFIGIFMIMNLKQNCTIDGRDCLASNKQGHILPFIFMRE